MWLDGHVGVVSLGARVRVQYLLRLCGLPLSCTVLSSLRQVAAATPPYRKEPTSASTPDTTFAQAGNGGVEQTVPGRECHTVSLALNMFYSTLHLALGFLHARDRLSLVGQVSFKTRRSSPQLLHPLCARASHGSPFVLRKSLCALPGGSVGTSTNKRTTLRTL